MQVAQVPQFNLLSDLDTVRRYTAEQLKDVAAITTALQFQDEKAINRIIEKYKDDAYGLDRLRPGITLEFRRRGLGQHLPAGN